MSRRRRWLFRIVAVTVIPGLFFLVLEVALRLAGFGYPADYFVKNTIDGRVAWVGNGQFCLRFFPPALVRPLERLVVSPQKAERTARIFILGSSAAQGDPAPSFGFSRILEVLLRERYPNRRFEVVNTAVTAINSNVVLPIAKDCARLEPDLFVLYLGNNEVIGPFGPATVFAPFARRLWFIRATMAAKATRIGQLVDAGARVLSRGERTPRDWGGMAMFLGNRIRHGDPRMEAVYEHFRQNLDDICRCGLRAGAKIIVCTLGVNLRDCAPFASLHRSGLPPAESARWDELYRQGNAAESAGRTAEAAGAYETAATIDDTFADLQFRLGRCYLALGRSDEAARRYALARDYDTLPFRANGRLAEILSNTGSGGEARGVYLADVARAFERASPDGLPGDELLYEHVHMSFHGNYVVARTVLEQVERSLGEASAGNMLSEAECAERLTFTGWDRRRIENDVLERMKSPPFTGQLDHAARVQALEDRIKRLQECGQPRELAEAEQACRRALDRSAEDWRLRENFARLLLEGRKDAAGAVEQYRLVVRAVPFDHLSHHNLALALREAGQFDEAVACHREALRIRPGFAAAVCALATTLARQGRTAEATECVTQVLKEQPAQAEAHAALGGILEQQGRCEEALAHFTKAGFSPADLAAAHNRIGVTLAKAGKTDEALARFAQALDLDPAFPEAHSNAGRALLRKRNTAAAEKHLREAVRLRPDLAEAQANLASLLLSQGQTGRAIEHLEKALQAKPDLAEVHNDLGAALASQGRLEEAQQHLVEALRLRPDMPGARHNLESVRAQLRGGVPK